MATFHFRKNSYGLVGVMNPHLWHTSGGSGEIDLMRKANMIKGKTMFALFAIAGAALSSGVAYAAVNGSLPMMQSAPRGAVDLSDFAAVPTSPVFLQANPGGTTVDLRITRNELMYEITWHGTAPTSVRLQGAGSARNMGMDMGTSVLPGSITSVEGVIINPSGRMLSVLVTNPGAFTANAAGKATFRRVNAFDFNQILHVGQFVSVNSGDQETTNGDIGAHATVFVGAAGTSTLSYAATWNGVASPTQLNINKGAAGAIGNLTAQLFRAPRGLDPTIVAVAGTATATPASVAALKANPAAFHTNLLTARFPAGAVRGQLFLATMPTTMPTMTTPPTTTMTMPTTTMPKPTMTMPTTTATMPPATSPAMPTPTTASVGAPPHW